MDPRLDRCGYAFRCHAPIGALVGELIEESLAMFLLLPIFALLSGLFYRRSDALYADRLVLSLHEHAFARVALTIGALVPNDWTTGPTSPSRCTSTRRCGRCSGRAGRAPRSSAPASSLATRLRSGLSSRPQLVLPGADLRQKPSPGD